MSVLAFEVITSEKALIPSFLAAGAAGFGVSVVGAPPPAGVFGFLCAKPAETTSDRDKAPTSLNIFKFLFILDYLSFLEL